MEEFVLSQCIGFEWDAGNNNKNWEKHSISQLECEELFFNDPLLVYEDLKHSQLENRMYALGMTDLNKRLFIVFTIRNGLIRVVSARSMNKKEREIYEKA